MSANNNNEDIAGAVVGNGGAIVDNNERMDEAEDEDEPLDEAERLISQRPSPEKIQELLWIRPHLDNIVIALETWDVTHEEKAHFYSGLFDPMLWTFVEMARLDWLDKTPDEKAAAVATAVAPSLPVLLTLLSMSAESNSPERPDPEAIQRLRQSRQVVVVLVTSLEMEHPAGWGIFQHAMHDPFVWTFLEMARLEAAAERARIAKAKKVATKTLRGLLASDQHAIPERARSE